MTYIDKSRFNSINRSQVKYLRQEKQEKEREFSCVFFFFDILCSAEVSTSRTSRWHRFWTGRHFSYICPPTPAAATRRMGYGDDRPFVAWFASRRRTSWVTSAVCTACTGATWDLFSASPVASLRRRKDPSSRLGRHDRRIPRVATLPVPRSLPRDPGSGRAAFARDSRPARRSAARDPPASSASNRDRPRVYGICWNPYSSSVLRSSSRMFH